MPCAFSIKSFIGKLKTFRNDILIIFIFGLIPALVSQFFVAEPSGRHIHVKNFRYGKDPSVIRVNRGDTLHLTFSTEDTGHSFFLEEFDIDAKISPAREYVEVFKASDPTEEPFLTKELSIVARHKGIRNWLVSKNQYRCHVWCGPMHAFESGKLVIMPNTLLMFSLGCIAGILFLWIRKFFYGNYNESAKEREGYHDLLKKEGILKKILVSRWPQIIVTIFAMMMIYIVILTSLFGTKMSGRNLGVLLMWAVWLFLLVAILTPFFGRIWCTVCPLPFLGDLIQRRSFFNPVKGKTNGYYNKFFGLSLKWPDRLQNNWLKLFFFLTLASFSTTMVADPKISGVVVIILILIPTIMALVWDSRAFCRYVCPVSVFLGPFAKNSPIALRNRSQQVCNDCTASFCEKGNMKGWACPYGLNVGEIKNNNDCGLCFECLRSCPYNNVTLYRRPFASETDVRNYAEAWGIIVVFTLAIVYSLLYQGHWPVIRDYVNILDKKNWDLFGIYILVLWTVSLVIMPSIIYFLSVLGIKSSGIGSDSKNAFMKSAGSLFPLGLMLWIAFVIPMLSVNITFIIQSFSDPFGWGWDFFGTANIPWHQFMPGMIPWIQALLIISGFSLSLRNLKRSWLSENMSHRQLFLITLPMAVFIFAVSVLLILFFTN
ncbi:MAG: 4Fe-4S binding protein [Bacteroidetes bacterium]|jgi:ferredoxin|nr:4Fe-4S binding protein [Bacteroidota bacterium]